jgi:hypothetical protein
MLKIYLRTTHYVILRKRQALPKNKKHDKRAGAHLWWQVLNTSMPGKRRRTESAPDSPGATQCSPSALEPGSGTDASDASDKSWSQGSSASDSGSDSESDAGTDSATETEDDADQDGESASEHESECSDRSRAASGADSDSGSSSQSDTETDASEDYRGATEH